MQQFHRVLLHAFLLLTINAYVTLAQTNELKPRLLVYFDSSRHRNIPVAVYTPIQKTKPKHELVILSHGYSPEDTNAYLAYSYLAEYFAGKGYFVLSVQQDQPGDAPMPREGNLQVLRRPFWETGTQNIQYVLSKLKTEQLDADLSHLILVGHSNGGDISALFAAQNPKRTRRLITLDNRRMALPRSKHTRVLSLRSADLPADPGVLPTTEEAKKFGMMIIHLKNTNHSEMDDDARPEQRKEITDLIGEFLMK